MSAWKLLWVLLFCLLGTVVETQAANYTVAQGDTLNGLAVRFNIRADTIVIENGIMDPEHIEIGQVLRIPHGTERIVARNINRHRWTLPGANPCNANCDVHKFVKENYPSDVAPYMEVLASGTYALKGAETLEQIESWSGNSVKNLHTLNPKLGNSPVLYKGQLLKLSLIHLPQELSGVMKQVKITSGDCFTAMMFGKNKTVRNICATWKQKPITAVEYRIVKNNVTYNMLRIDICGNWAKPKQSQIPVLPVKKVTKEVLVATLLPPVVDVVEQKFVIAPVPEIKDHVVAPTENVSPVKMSKVEPQAAPEVIPIPSEPRILIPGTVASIAPKDTGRGPEIDVPKAPPIIVTKVTVNTDPVSIPPKEVPPEPEVNVPQSVVIGPPTSPVPREPEKTDCDTVPTTAVSVPAKDVPQAPTVEVPGVQKWALQKDQPEVVMPPVVEVRTPVSPAPTEAEKITDVVAPKVSSCHTCPDIKPAFIFPALPYGTPPENEAMRRFYGGGSLAVEVNPSIPSGVVMTKSGPLRTKNGGVVRFGKN